MAWIAEHTDPAGRAGQHIAQGGSELGSVMIGDDDVGQAVEYRSGGDDLDAVAAPGRTCRVGLEQHRAVAEILGVAEEVASDGRREHGDQGAGVRRFVSLAMCDVGRRVAKGFRHDGQSSMPFGVAD